MWTLSRILFAQRQASKSIKIANIFRSGIKPGIKTEDEDLTCHSTELLRPLIENCQKLGKERSKYTTGWFASFRETAAQLNSFQFSDGSFTTWEQRSNQPAQLPSVTQTDVSMLELSEAINELYKALLGDDTSSACHILSDPELLQRWFEEMYIIGIGIPERSLDRLAARLRALVRERSTDIHTIQASQAKKQLSLLHVHRVALLNILAKAERLALTATITDPIRLLSRFADSCILQGHLLHRRSYNTLNTTPAGQLSEFSGNVAEMLAEDAICFLHAKTAAGLGCEGLSPNLASAFQIALERCKAARRLKYHLCGFRHLMMEVGLDLKVWRNLQFAKHGAEIFVETFIPKTKETMLRIVVLEHLSLVRNKYVTACAHARALSTFCQSLNLEELCREGGDDSAPLVLLPHGLRQIARLLSTREAIRNNTWRALEASVGWINPIISKVTDVTESKIMEPLVDAAGHYAEVLLHCDRISFHVLNQAVEDLQSLYLKLSMDRGSLSIRRFLAVYYSVHQRLKLRHMAFPQTQSSKVLDQVTILLNEASPPNNAKEFLALILLYRLFTSALPSNTIRHLRNIASQFLRRSDTVTPALLNVFLVLLLELLDSHADPAPLFASSMLSVVVTRLVTIPAAAFKSKTAVPVLIDATILKNTLKSYVDDKTLLPQMSNSIAASLDKFPTDQCAWSIAMRVVSFPAASAKQASLATASALRVCGGLSSFQGNKDGDLISNDPTAVFRHLASKFGHRACLSSLLTGLPRHELTVLILHDLMGEFVGTTAANLTRYDFGAEVGVVSIRCLTDHFVATSPPLRLGIWWLSLVACDIKLLTWSLGILENAVKRVLGAALVYPKKDAQKVSENAVKEETENDLPQNPPKNAVSTESTGEIVTALDVLFLLLLVTVTCNGRIPSHTLTTREVRKLAGKYRTALHLAPGTEGGFEIEATAMPDEKLVINEVLYKSNALLDHLPSDPSTLWVWEQLAMMLQNYNDLLFEPIGIFILIIGTRSARHELVSEGRLEAFGRARMWHGMARGVLREVRRRTKRFSVNAENNPKGMANGSLAGAGYNFRILKREVYHLGSEMAQLCIEIL